MRRSLIPILVAVLCSSEGSAAPTFEALYLENSTLPGANALPGFVTTDVVRNNGSMRAAVNAYGDFVGRVHTKLGNFDAQNNTIYYYFGSIAGSAPTALRREAMLAGEYQNIFGPFAGIAADGSLTYSATLGSGLSGAASLWRDDSLIYQEGDVIPAGPFAGKYFGGVAGNVYTRPNGESLWRMSYRDTADGPDVGSAIVSGLSTFDSILKSGDAIGDLGNVAAGTSVFTNPAYSIAGTNFSTSVALNGGGEVVIVNNIPQQFASGGYLLEGDLIPFSDGGQTDDGTAMGAPIETLQLGTEFAVNEVGDFAFSASTEFTNDGDTNVDFDVVVYNGRILFREGDTIDGVTLSGQFEGLDLNDRGDLVFGWEDRLFLWNAESYPDGTLLAELGTSVQLPGGAAGTLRRIAVGQITATNMVAAGGDNLPVVYFGGSVNPGDLTSLVRLVAAPSVDGDFNQDGVVNLADYTLWRDSLGSQSTLAADADRDGVVDADDYLVWKVNFGLTATIDSSVAPTAVPEPTSLILVLSCMVAMLLGDTRRT